MICRVASNWPRPKPSTPALFETAVRFLTPLSRRAAISASGMPHRPKPPTATIWPSLTTPSSAAKADLNVLSMAGPAASPAQSNWRSLDRFPILRNRKVLWISWLVAFSATNREATSSEIALAQALPSEKRGLRPSPELSGCCPARLHVRGAGSDRTCKAVGRDVQSLGHQYERPLELRCCSSPQARPSWQGRSAWRRLCPRRVRHRRSRRGHSRPSAG